MSFVEQPVAESGLIPTELPESGFNPAHYLRLVARRWRLVAVVCLLTTAAGLVHFFITPPAYRAASVLQIEQRSPLAIGSDRNPWLEAWVSMKYYPTQYRLLRSRGLAERVVENLRLMDDPAFNPRRSELPRSDGERAVSADDDRLAVARLANRLLAGLDVEPIKETELVEVSYVASDPELASRIVNGLAEAFIDWGIETRSETVYQASTFLADQLEEIKGQIQSKERQLQEYSRESDIVVLDPESNVTLQKLQRFYGDYFTARGQRIEKQARFKELESSPGEAIAEIQSDGLVAELRRKLVGMEQEYEIKLQTYKPNWPDMVDLKAQIDETALRLRRLVDERAEESRESAYGEYQTALRRESALAAEIQKIKNEALDLNSLSVEYNNLQMEIAAQRDLQDELLKQLSAAGVSASLTGTRASNIRVVDAALVPTAPFRPSLRRDLTLGLGSGLLLGVALVFLIHLLDRTVKSPEELENLLGFPVLAVIPDLGAAGRGYGGYGGYGAYGSRRKGSRRRPERAVAAEVGVGGTEKEVRVEMLPELQPRLAISEAYRSLRTALMLSSARALKVVTITSAEAAEGKTATAVNLAIVLAQLGRRVLLIDGDLRKPRLHKVLQVSNRHGLVNLLTAAGDPETCYLPTSIKGLHICPSGPHSPNPSELLASERMTDFIQQARNRFDFVIVDTPPTLAVADAILPASLSDGVVLCLRAHKVLREDVRSCRDRLLLAEVKILGAVLNRFQPTRSGYYSRRYHYYEAYGGEQVEDHAA